MMPIFANPLGFWALLGLPAILAIHFLQQQSRVVRTSTWFLIEKLAPDSARGRTWEQLRSSRQLWLQLLAVLLATWLLTAPRWVRAESAQTIVLVLDASASMEAFREPALAAAEREMSSAEGRAAHTTWVVMTTDPRQPPLYRGLDRISASETLARWQPELGVHDFGPSLRLAQGLAGETGRTLLITDTRAKVPAAQRAAGVGKAFHNVGFAGFSIGREDNGHVWRALVKNHGTERQRRTWRAEIEGVRSAEQSVEIEPGALAEISARFPEGADALTIVLESDAFTADDHLPLVRPQPKPLSVSIEGTDPAAEFFRKIAVAMDGVTLVGAGAPGSSALAKLRIARLADEEIRNETRAGIFWPPADKRAQAALSTEAVIPERDPLVAGLNWQGWFGTGVYGYSMSTGDTPLVWQGRHAMIFSRPVTSGGRKLLLAFDWDTSNASRLPATVLLMRRFLETERDAQAAPFAANFDCSSEIALVTEAGRENLPASSPITIETKAVAPVSSTAATSSAAPPEPSEWKGRAPGRPGFFTLRQQNELLLRGASQFADTRQGDFRAAETFTIELPGESRAALERNTRPDPLATLWLLVLAGLALWSWWERISRSQAIGAPKPGPGVPASAS